MSETRAFLAQTGGESGDDCRNDSGPGERAAGVELPSLPQAIDHLPADLALVVNAWPNLSAESRAAILAVIDGQAAAAGPEVRS